MGAISTVCTVWSGSASRWSHFFRNDVTDNVVDCLAAFVEDEFRLDASSWRVISDIARALNDDTKSGSMWLDFFDYADEGDEDDADVDVDDIADDAASSSTVTKTPPLSRISHSTGSTGASSSSGQANALPDAVGAKTSLPLRVFFGIFSRKEHRDGFVPVPACPELFGTPLPSGKLMEVTDLLDARYLGKWFTFEELDEKGIFEFDDPLPGVDKQFLIVSRTGKWFRTPRGSYGWSKTKFRVISLGPHRLEVHVRWLDTKSQGLKKSRAWEISV